MYKKIVIYYTMPILKNINMIKKVKNQIYLNITNILLNKIQIILERFCMKIGSGMKPQL